MGGTYTYIVGIFGFIFFSLVLVIQISMVESFDLWVVTGASGYDANIQSLFSQMLFYWPVIGMLSTGLWFFNEQQKEKSGFA